MIRVFLLAGQSNMRGAGITAEIAGRVTPPATVRLFDDGAWRDLLWQERFGPECGFALDIAAAFPDDQIVLCKVARGGANLYYDWNPDGVSKGPEDACRGPLYPLLTDAFTAVRREVDRPDTAKCACAVCSGCRGNGMRFLRPWLPPMNAIWPDLLRRSAETRGHWICRSSWERLLLASTILKSVVSNTPFARLSRGPGNMSRMLTRESIWCIRWTFRNETICILTRPDSWSSAGVWPGPPWSCHLKRVRSV